MDFKLPSSLRKRFLNLSVTIQSLVGDIVLHLEGVGTEANRRDEAKYDQAARARRANELAAEQLREFLRVHALSPSDSAVAMGAAAGRSTKEIADFLGLEQSWVMRRLCAVRKTVAKWADDRLRGQAELFEAEIERAEVLEMFSEAQRMRPN